MEETPTSPPPVLANSRVLQYAVLDKEVRYSGHGSLFVDGKELGPVPCLAVCQGFDEDAVLVLHSDRDWTVLGVAAYASLTEAETHAERAYPGVSGRWVKTLITEHEALRYHENVSKDLRCTFCGKGPDEVIRLIEKRGAGICDSCIAEFHQMLHEDLQTI